MATVKTTSVQIKTDDLKGCGSVEFNTDTKLQESPIKMTWGVVLYRFQPLATTTHF